MRTVFVTVGTLSVSILLLAAGQRVLFAAWSTSVWAPSAPVKSMVFDDLVLYTLFPLVVIIGTVVATAPSRSRPFAVSILGTLPVFLGAVILRRDAIAALALYVIGYAVLCFVTVKLTNWLRRAGTGGGQHQMSPGT